MLKVITVVKLNLSIPTNIKSWHINAWADLPQNF